MGSVNYAVKVSVSRALPRPDGACFLNWLLFEEVVIMSQSEISARNIIGSILAAAFIMSCGDRSNNSEATLQGQKPADSQGLAASLELRFTASVPALAPALASSLDLGQGIVLNDARINLGSIRLKPGSDDDAKEHEAEREWEQLRESMKQSVKAERDNYRAQIDELEETYKERIKNAKSKDEEDALKVTMIAEISAIEAKLATMEKAKEDEMDALRKGSDDSVIWQGPYVYDLVQDTVTPALPKATVFDGIYRRVKFEIRPNRSLPATDPLLNRSIFMSGTVSLEGQAVPFTFALKLFDNVKVLSDQGAYLEASADNTLLINFQPASWFNGLDFSSAVRGEDGVIVIDENSNQVLLSTIRGKIEESTRLNHGKSRSGQVGDDNAPGEDHHGGDKPEDDGPGQDNHGGDKPEDDGPGQDNHGGDKPEDDRPAA
jgi:hypothetical protein